MVNRRAPAKDIVRRFADGAVTNEQGDTFELRMVEEGGAPLGASRNPVLRLAIRPGHVGGTFVETPGRIGPWRASNGDLYFIMEPAETNNLFMMIKSADDGRTWREVDGANRPPTRDLEAVDARQVGDTIHILHEVSRSARYHSFRTSDHPTHPDTWHVRGELVSDAAPVAQAAALEVRSDGSLVALYVEMLKSTRTGTSSVIEHSLSVLLFVVFLIEFIVVPGAGTATFLLLTLMSLLSRIVNMRKLFGAA